MADANFKTPNAPASIYRDKEGMGVWEHRGKVAVVGIGHSPAARRWDERLETSLGAYSLIAARKALDDAGISKDQVDGVVAVPTGLGAPWGGAYFEPPYDSEDGLSGVSADWLVKNMGLNNAQFTIHGPGCISNAMCVAAQSVAEGKAHTVIVLRATGNMPGRYGQYGAAAEDVAKGPQQWTNPWGWQLIPQIAFGFDQYCRKYGSSHDAMANFVVTARQNGLNFPEGYYAQNRPEALTAEDYLASRWICKPMNINDCDMPIQAAAAYIMTTAERAKDMNQKPVYVLNHSSNIPKVRSMVQTLDETEASAASIAKKALEGAGITSSELDVFNPYDGFTLFTQYYVEAFQWHGVKKGEAHAFYQGDISAKGPHPLMPSGGNNGSGRTRYWHWTDTIQQLQGRAGARQVTIKNGKPETGIAGGPTPGPARSDWMVFGTSPD